MTVEQILEHAIQATPMVCDDEGNGCGFVVDRRGVVVTARHGVKRRRKVSVHFRGHEPVEGKVVLSHLSLDYAFVLVPPCEVSFRLNENLLPRVGMKVFAIGAPDGLPGSVTQGIVSATDRVEGDVHYIQTDADATFGYSGGPLINEKGFVVGMNVWGRGETRCANFALPVTYLTAPLWQLQAMLGDLDRYLYCVECGKANDDDSLLKTATWICCGRCGAKLQTNDGEEERESE